MKLKNIIGLKWVGLLSVQDADILASYGYKSKSVLEFGSGGSTLIFAQTSHSVISVDTSLKWIDIVQERIKTAQCNNVSFRTLNSVSESSFHDNTFDFIFVDGKPAERLTFAIRAWKWLKIGGALAFHDANKSNYISIVSDFMSKNIRSINNCIVCPPADDGIRSNLAIFTKMDQPKNMSIDYSSWMDDERIIGRPEWSFGDNADTSLLWEYIPNKLDN